MALTDRNLLGVKGVGEAGTSGSTPTLWSAVLDALLPLGVVYLNTAPIPDGMSLLETYPPEAQQMIREHVAERGAGWR